MASTTEESIRTVPTTPVSVVSSGSTSTTTAFTIIQNLMSTAVQQAIPCPQERITASLDQRIQTAMDQQTERMRSWLPTDRLTEDTITSTAGTRAGTDTGVSHGAAVTLPSLIPSVHVPRAGSIVPASLIASVPLTSVASTTTALGSSSSVVTPHTPLAALMTSAEQEASIAKTKKEIVIGSTFPPIPYKLAESIWRDEYVDLAELLPVRLGAPEPTLLELFAGHQKKQPISKRASRP